MTTAQDIAHWLLEQIQDNGQRRTYQERIVRIIRNDFGEAWSYRNQNGNWAIDRTILREFGKLKSDHLIWDRSDQSWRIVTDDQLDLIRQREERSKERRAAIKVAGEARIAALTDTERAALQARKGEAAARRAKYRADRAVE
ncbi:hypothetical protein [Frigoribacterium sp. VKM Ac-2836]|uniref:DUF6953 family protein n=1 Tax=Frigoribacterium sp. VKM Ac-2836 TaxID=2739014 RepID=UPI0015674B34|nr:hypothetical protein [Frigoribacterium sp. VKM Ac-2836]NRD26347.1 hypothetical protein [Frigoribacterium sp. VKM Ac-2836]